MKKGQADAKEQLSCPVYKKCGGCQLDVSYPQQLSYKFRLVKGLLGRFGKVEPVLGMKDPLHYRCKVSTAFGYSHGRVISGVWQSTSGKLVTVGDCALEDERARTITEEIRRLLGKFRLRTYDERTGRGYLRFVTVRVGKATGEILIALGTGDGVFSGEEDFVRELTEKCPEITTVVRCVSTGRLNLLLGEKETVLYGPGYITDVLCGMTFQISARSFFQINPVQTQALYKTAVDMAGLDGTQTVIDAYCGVGTIGIIASVDAGKVLAVEANGDAVHNARENVILNSVENVQVYRDDAGKFMERLAEEGQNVDVVFTDPPRAGCGRKFLSSLLRLAPKKIVYISCNPETQARDLAALVRGGYTVMRIKPVDMFPYTRHIETVVLLSRKDIRGAPNLM